MSGGGRTKGLCWILIASKQFHRLLSYPLFRSALTQVCAHYSRSEIASLFFGAPSTSYINLHTSKLGYFLHTTACQPNDVCNIGGCMYPHQFRYNSTTLVKNGKKSKNFMMLTGSSHSIMVGNKRPPMACQPSFFSLLCSSLRVQNSMPRFLLILQGPRHGANKSRHALTW